MSNGTSTIVTVFSILATMAGLMTLQVTLLGRVLDSLRTSSAACAARSAEFATRSAAFATRSGRGSGIEGRIGRLETGLDRIEHGLIRGLDVRSRSWSGSDEPGPS